MLIFAIVKMEGSIRRVFCKLTFSKFYLFRQNFSNFHSVVMNRQAESMGRKIFTKKKLIQKLNKKRRVAVDVAYVGSLFYLKFKFRINI